MGETGFLGSFHTPEHVLISVPSLDYTITSNIGHLFALAQRRNATQNKYKFTISTMEGVVGYDLVRNNICRLFLTGPFDRLWMIDNDIMPGEDSFDILDVDADIVAPLMPTFKSNMTNGEDGVHFEFSTGYAAGNYEDLENFVQASGPDISERIPVDVDMVGTGCMAIRRKVLEDPRMHYPSDDTEEGDPPSIFKYHTKSNGAYELGEDADFCVRARRLGYKVMLHAGVEVGHLRAFDIGHIFKVKSHYTQVGVGSTATTVAKPVQVADAIK